MSKKRKSIPAKMRFEVFKRDKFTCQYCGAQSPEVVLHIDHIKPVAKGGGNTITNFITSCIDCNLGKGDRLISDDSVVAKASKQAAELQERRNQIEMMMQWRQELDCIEDESIARLSDYWKSQLGGKCHLNEVGIKQLKSLCKKFSVQEVLSAMRIAVETYVEFSNGNLVTQSAERAWSKVGGICHLTRTKKDNPDVSEIYYIRGIVKNRLKGRYYDSNKAIMLIKQAKGCNATTESLRNFAKEINSWSEFKDGILAFCEGQND